MLRRLTVLCVLLALCSGAVAAGPTLVITDRGYQVMALGADGKAVLQDVGQVVDLRGSPGPSPGPGPLPPVSDPIALQVSGWAKDVGDPTSAQALVIAYREVGKVSAGQSRDKVVQALRMATDSVLTSTGGAEKWKPWRGKVSALIDAEEAKGPISWPTLCESIAKGLEASAPAPALDPALLQLIVNAVLQIIQLIFNLTGGGGGIGGV